MPKRELDEYCVRDKECNDDAEIGCFTDPVFDGRATPYKNYCSDKRQFKQGTEGDGEDETCNESADCANGASLGCWEGPADYSGEFPLTVCTDVREIGKSCAGTPDYCVVGAEIVESPDGKLTCSNPTGSGDNQGVRCISNSCTPYTIME